MISAVPHRDNRHGFGHARPLWKDAMFEFGHATHPGLKRQFNEDAYAIDAAAGVFVVVDGMGGPGHGEAVAALACDETLRAARLGVPLDAAVRRAAAAVSAYLAQHPAGHPAGAALAVLRLAEPDFELAWVGDCGILLGGSDAAQVARAADLPCSDEHAAQRPSATELLGLGASDTLCVGLRKGRLRHPVAILLCSDGVIDASTPQARQQALIRHDLSAQESVEHLLLDALAHHARDNLSAILVRLRH
jgi:protein phosphatase